MTAPSEAAERIIRDHGDAMPSHHLAVAILRAVHPYIPLAQLAVTCGMTKHQYAGIWRRISRPGVSA